MNITDLGLFGSPGLGLWFLALALGLLESLRRAKLRVGDVSSNRYFL